MTNPVNISKCSREGTTRIILPTSAPTQEGGFLRSQGIHSACLAGNQERLTLGDKALVFEQESTFIYYKLVIFHNRRKNVVSLSTSDTPGLDQEDFQKYLC